MLHKCRVFFNEHCMTAATKRLFNQTDLSCKKNPHPAAIQQESSTLSFMGYWFWGSQDIFQNFSKIKKQGAYLCLYILQIFPFMCAVI